MANVPKIAVRPLKSTVNSNMTGTFAGRLKKAAHKIGENSLGRARKLFVTFHRDVLIVPELGMLQWHVEESPVDRRKHHILPLLHGFPTEFPGLTVLIKRHGTAAEDVPGKLIQQDDFGECPTGLTAPVVQPLLRREKHHGQETPANLLIELAV